MIKNLMYHIFKNKLVFIGLLIIIILYLTAIIGPLTFSLDPEKMDIPNKFAPPSKENWFGTDQFGRDIFIRIIYGARLSIIVSITSVTLAASLGTLFGLLAGFYKGITDEIIMRWMDIMFTIPVMLIAIGLVAFTIPSTKNVIFAIGIAYTPQFTRIIRSQVLVVREEDYIKAAFVAGASDRAIIFRQILLNCLHVIIVQYTVFLAAAVVLEAALSFLGLGTPPPTPSWGRMLSEARDFLTIAPWSAIFPGIMIILVVMGYNFLGDGLRDLLDPKMAYLFRKNYE